MKAKRSNRLGIVLKNFFRHYLPHLKGMSPHTILSYRDSLKLCLQFLAEHKNLPVSKIQVEDLEVSSLITFLDHLEQRRGNGVGTRNIRLAALHSFFRYLAGLAPEFLDQAQRILNLPFKRAITRTIDYLEVEEFQAVLQAVDRSRADGRRDYALLLLLFNTGARVQEIVDLRANDFQWSKPFSVHLFGKGRKERICPLWDETAACLREYLEEQGIDARKPATVFCNHLGTPLTRYGIRYLLAKYLRKVYPSRPALQKKHLHPHSLRHSLAFHLLKSGVDLCSIANWLGHVSVTTSNKYVSLDLEMKRQALDKAQPLVETDGNLKNWKQDPDIIAWLESL